MKKSLIATFICGVMIAQPVSAGMVVPTANAVAPLAIPAGAVLPAVQGGQFMSGGDAEVIEVRKRWRHRHHRHRHRHRSSGWGTFGTGVAVGIIGALIARGISESAAHDRFARCARDFDTFDPESGTYITRSGRERLCPYLR